MSSQPYIGSYIGTHKIKSTSLIPNTSKMLVTFEDDSTIELTILLLDASISDTQLDPTTLRDKQDSAVALKIIQLFLDWDMPVGDVQYVTSLVVSSISEWETQGDIKKWGKTRNKVLMSELDSVLKGQ